MSSRKEIVCNDPMALYAQYSKFFQDPPNAESIWNEPFKKPKPEDILQDPVDEKVKAGIIIERRFLGKGSDVNILRAMRLLVHRIPDFPLTPGKTEMPFTVGNHRGAFKIFTAELSQTEPTLRGISQKALRGMYDRVIENYRGMTHLLSKVRGKVYQTPDTVMWRAAGALSHLDTVYRGEPEEPNVVYGVEQTEQHVETKQHEENEMDEHENPRFDIPPAHDKTNDNYNGEPSTGLQETMRRLQKRHGATVSRKRMADSTEPLEATLTTKRAQRAGEGRTLSYPANGNHHLQERRAVTASRSPSVESTDLPGPERDGRHYITSSRDRSRDDSHSYGRHYSNYNDTMAREYRHSRKAPPPSSPFRDRRSHSRNTASDLVEYQDELEETAHMEDLIRSLHRDTRIQMANMRSAIETQQAQLDSLQDTLDTILRRIPTGSSHAQHQQRQGRVSASLLDTIDERYYDQEDEPTQRRYGLNRHNGKSRSWRASMYDAFCGLKFF
ncbi:hypothetical protein BG015_000866 [Linnemannia schmuckeri]|uniref:Uncharacterized protein n=1 Tax=Linnemannia schmuckeri TaxID=64567 RepID=A0A9P5S473_9FUNG|nr:hypothetical protein BG015_000866 [Linnemannia schmuckeri]